MCCAWRKFSSPRRLYLLNNSSTVPSGLRNSPTVLRPHGLNHLVKGFGVMSYKLTLYFGLRNRVVWIIQGNHGFRYIETQNERITLFGNPCILFLLLFSFSPTVSSFVLISISRDLYSDLCICMYMCIIHPHSSKSLYGLPFFALWKTSRNIMGYPHKQRKNYGSWLTYTLHVKCTFPKSMIFWFLKFLPFFYASLV